MHQEIFERVKQKHAPKPFPWGKAWVRRFCKNDMRKGNLTMGLPFYIRCLFRQEHIPQYLPTDNEEFDTAY